MTNKYLADDILSASDGPTICAPICRISDEELSVSDIAVGPCRPIVCRISDEELSASVSAGGPCFPIPERACRISDEELSASDAALVTCSGCFGGCRISDEDLSASDVSPSPSCIPCYINA